MTSPELLAELDDTILVEFGQFVLQETPALRTAQAIGPPPEGTRAKGGPGGIVFLSQVSDHYPQVRIELWNQRPEPSTSRWNTTEELTLNLTEGVQLRSLTMEISDHVLPLPRAGDYSAIVHVRDDPQADEIEDGSFTHTGEHWLVQLWPVNATPAEDR